MTIATPAREPQALNKLMFVKLMPLLIIAYILSFWTALTSPWPSITWMSTWAFPPLHTDWARGCFS